MQSCDFRANRQKLTLQHLNKKCLEMFFQPTCLLLGLKSKKNTFSGAGVWIFFDKCQFVGKRQQIKGRAIKRFLFGSKSWWKDVESILTYHKKCAILPDQSFVFLTKTWNCKLMVSKQSQIWQKWKWSLVVRRGEINLFWCIFITNNVKSWQNSMKGPKQQTSVF